jgi:hypothetical protein
MKCPYCGKTARFISSKNFYGKDFGMNIYSCIPCDAYVGTHGDTTKPLGTMANHTLRELRKICHSTFDPYWKHEGMTRTEAYKWLQQRMDLPAEQAHIAMFDTTQCYKLIKIILEVS